MSAQAWLIAQLVSRYGPGFVLALLEGFKGLGKDATLDDYIDVLKNAKLKELPIVPPTQ